MNQLTIDVTDLRLFNGLYESIWLNSDIDIDDVVELADMIGVDLCDIDVTIDYNEYLESIGELYCEMFCNELDSVGTFRVDSLYSPRWYNYNTGHIAITWDSDVLTIEEMKSKLKGLCDDNDNRNDWTIEIELWIDRSHEIYSNLVRYTYNDKPLWFGMGNKDIEDVKG